MGRRTAGASRPRLPSLPIDVLLPCHCGEIAIKNPYVSNSAEGSQVLTTLQWIAKYDKPGLACGITVQLRDQVDSQPREFASDLVIIEQRAANEADRNKQRRQLFGYGIAAKRYAIYTTTENDIEIVELKAHGLGYFYPPKDSPEGWKHETPKWIFEAWDWIMRGVLGLKLENYAWFDLPVMMKLTLNTPHHALRNIGKVRSPDPTIS